MTRDESTRSLENKFHLCIVEIKMAATNTGKMDSLDFIPGFWKRKRTAFAIGWWIHFIIYYSNILCSLTWNFTTLVCFFGTFTSRSCQLPRLSLFTGFRFSLALFRLPPPERTQPLVSPKELVDWFSSTFYRARPPPSPLCP